jgi:MFS transporter, AAHS family, benzoate transport protein
VTPSTQDGAVRQDALRRRSVTWIVSLATVGLVFDGYDLVVYGAVVPLFLRDPGQVGEVTPALAGALGSYALIGVLVGALVAGSVADVIGRRKVMLTACAWFSVGMALTALATSTTTFGLLRFVTGIGVGALVATTGALVAEFAPAGRKTWPTRSPTRECRWAACSPLCWPSCCWTSSAGGACSGSAPCRC